MVTGRRYECLNNEYMHFVVVVVPNDFQRAANEILSPQVRNLGDLLLICCCCCCARAASASLSRLAADQFWFTWSCKIALQFARALVTGGWGRRRHHTSHTTSNDLSSESRTACRSSSATALRHAAHWVEEKVYWPPETDGSQFAMQERNYYVCMCDAHVLCAPRRTNLLHVCIAYLLAASSIGLYKWKR